MARLAVLTALVLSLPARSYSLLKDQDGDVVRWRKPVTIVVDERAVPAIDGLESAVRAAAQTLDDAAPELSMTVQVGAVGAVGYDPAAAQNQNEVVLVSEWPYSDDWLAATLVTLNTRTNSIIDADILVNVEDHTFKVLDHGLARDGNSSVHDVQNALTHELGHVAGLLHNDTDPEVVMYPHETPGETDKRVLAEDDRDGLSTLYQQSSAAPGAATPTANAAQAQEPQVPTVGCSSSGGSPLALAALLVAAAVLRRRRGLALIAALAPAVALAGGTAKVHEIAPADDVMAGQVVSTKTTTVPQLPGLLITEVEVQVSQCLKGRCDQRVVLHVPGGEMGDRQQLLIGQPVPRQGDPLMVVRGAKLRLYRLKEPKVRDEVGQVLTRAQLPALQLSQTK